MASPLLNNRVKSWLRKLKRNEQQTKEKLFFVTGVKNVLMLLESTYQIHTLVVAPKLYQAWQEKELLSASYPIYIAPPDVISSISPLTTNEQVVAVAYQQPPAPPLNTKKLPSRLLLLDRISQPSNLGALLRVAAWYHIPQLIYAPQGVRHYNAKVVQASMGAFFHVKIGCQPLLPLLHQLKNENMPIIGAVLTGSPLATTNLPPRAALLVGNEAKGIAPELHPYITQTVTITKRNPVMNSLNVAVATGIICEKWCQAG